jgi:hypothetical protein
MNKETLRMQMLAGIITEGQYKEKLNENKEKDEYYEKLRRDSIDGKGPTFGSFPLNPGEWKKPEEPSESEQRETARRGIYGVDAILADPYNNGYSTMVKLDNGSFKYTTFKGEEGIKMYLEDKKDTYKNHPIYSIRKKHDDIQKAIERYEELKTSGELDTLKDI